MVHEVWGQKDHPSGLDRNPVQILALRIHIKDRGQLNVCPGTCSFQAQCYLPVGAKLKNCKLRGTYLIHISKVPPLGASVDPSGETACVGLHPQLLDRFTPFLLNLFVTRTPYHQKSCDLEWWVACCEDSVVKSRVHAAAD